MIHSRGYFPNATLDVAAAEARYPRMFAELRKAGWTPERDVPVPTEFEERVAKMGFYLDDYQEAFYHSFGGLRVKLAQPPTRDGHVYYNGLTVGDGNQLDIMCASDTQPYICRLAETYDVFPLIMGGGNAVFVRNDAFTLAVEQTFVGCATSAEPFEMMHWILFQERGPTLAVRELTAKERPAIFR